MPKTFLIVWFKIDYEIYLLTNKNQENREDKKKCVSSFPLFTFVSPSRVFLSTVPCLCLVVLCAHRALPGSFDKQGDIILGAILYASELINLWGQ